MVERLTEDETRRNRKSARTPAYARDPEKPLSEGAETESADTDVEEPDEFASAVPDAGRRREDATSFPRGSTSPRTGQSSRPTPASGRCGLS